MKDFAGGALVGALVGGVIGVVVGGVCIAAVTQKSSPQSGQQFTMIRGPRLELRGPKLIHQSGSGHCDSNFEPGTDVICEPKQDDTAEA